MPRYLVSVGRTVAFTVNEFASLDVEAPTEAEARAHASRALDANDTSIHWESPVTTNQAVRRSWVNTVRPETKADRMLFD